MDRNMIVRKKIAVVVREKRRKLEMTQESLGFAIKRTDSFISAVELGKSSFLAEDIPLIVEKLRFKSIADFWQQVVTTEVDLIDDGWD
jgi:ribosome-binding protein aMBF1 (putative translation factor)